LFCFLIVEESTMGILVNGKWVTEAEQSTVKPGSFKPNEGQFRNWITPDGSAGPTGKAGFKAEAGRYHLYVAYSCPFAHRTLIYRKLKKLENIISVSVVDYQMDENGWNFSQRDGATGDKLYHLSYLHELYCRSDPTCSGRVTVPVLWDRDTETIVSNESAEIMRMFNSAFDGITGSTLDLYPKDLQTEIDAMNQLVFEDIHTGVYKAGFARTQEAYEAAVVALFDALNMIDQRLGKSRYLMGDKITEADWRLFPSLLRFDPVYVSLFKCNVRRLIDYPNLFNYLKDLYQQPGIAQTCNMMHIKNSYYKNFHRANPTGIVPIGPKLFLDGPHHREKVRESLSLHVNAAES